MSRIDRIRLFVGSFLDTRVWFWTFCAIEGTLLTVCLIGIFSQLFGDSLSASSPSFTVADLDRAYQSYRVERVYVPPGYLNSLNKTVIIPRRRYGGFFLDGRGG